MEPEIVDLWESTTEIVGDAAVARRVIEHLVPRLWNLPWSIWHSYSLSVAKQ